MKLNNFLCVRTRRYVLLDYASTKSVTVPADNQTTSDAVLSYLVNASLDPLADLFPGATIDPQDMIRAMASRNPNEFIRSEVNINGFDECDT